MFGDPVTNPKGWEVYKISELCAEIVDCVNRTAPVVEGPTPYKMIRTTNVRNYSIDLTNVRYVSQPIYEKWTRRLIPERGDIVYTREAPVGEAGIFVGNDHVFLGQRTMHFRPDLSKATSEYLLFELMGNSVARQLQKMGAGSTVKHLSVPECKTFQVRQPPIEMQEKFTGIANFIKDMRDKNDSAFRPGKLCFESCSQRAFRGELS